MGDTLSHDCDNLGKIEYEKNMEVTVLLTMSKEPSESLRRIQVKTKISRS